MRERTPLPAELIARLPNLKLVLTTGARNAAIDVAACAARGVPVAGTPLHAKDASQPAPQLQRPPPRPGQPFECSFRIPVVIGSSSGDRQPSGTCRRGIAWLSVWRW